MASKDNLSISLKVKYNFICTRLKLSHAYRYRQYCGKRERGKFANQICLLRLASIKSTAESCRTEPSRMCYLPEECYIPLSFPLKFCYFLPAKSTRFLIPEPSPSWSVMRAKTLGTKIPPLSARGPLFRGAETTS